jgi:hypothetical protein
VRKLTAFNPAKERAAMQESPIAAQVSQIVMVREKHPDAPTMGDGSFEMPAIVTKVWDRNTIECTAFPTGGAPRPLHNVVYDASHDAAGVELGACWSWPQLEGVAQPTAQS